MSRSNQNIFKKQFINNLCSVFSQSFTWSSCLWSFSPLCYLPHVASYLFKCRYHILLLLRNIQWSLSAFSINYLPQHRMFLITFSSYLSNFISSQHPSIYVHTTVYLLLFDTHFLYFHVFLLLWRSDKRMDFRAGQT